MVQFAGIVFLAVFSFSTLSVSSHSLLAFSVSAVKSRGGFTVPFFVMFPIADSIFYFVFDSRQSDYVYQSGGGLYFFAVHLTSFGLSGSECLFPFPDLVHFQLF